jgi:hypothetical protein
MDYYQNVVVDYLRADRAVFVNTEYCLQINPGNPDKYKGLHWYCDAVALDFRTQTVFLCEISYAEGLTALIKRLRGWHENWDGIRLALVRDSALPQSWTWTVKPWLFVPEKEKSSLEKQLGPIKDELHAKITLLEDVQPWKYHSWDRKDECDKPENPE